MTPSTPVSTPASTPNPAPAPVHSAQIGNTPREVAAEHARQLLVWLQDSAWPNGRRLDADDMRAVYSEMCAHKGLNPRPWNAVAAPFARLIHQPGRPLKTYRRIVDEKGQRRRVRSYEIP
ncbi:hypothetical protein [Pseudorhodoplanes sp.]|uniref:hypothetical protein n=1 Tax=Pseudorhodoplanes sp. TaxID=1934341 RepID=UPI003D0D9F8E